MEFSIDLIRGAVEQWDELVAHSKNKSLKIEALELEADDYRRKISELEAEVSRLRAQQPRDQQGGSLRERIRYL